MSNPYVIYCILFGIFYPDKGWDFFNEFVLWFLFSFVSKNVLLCSLLTAIQSTHHIALIMRYGTFHILQIWGKIYALSEVIQMMAKMLLGDLVKDKRQRLKLSQNTLAEKSHVSLRTVADIESYNGNPRFETLFLLVQYLNISLDSIILKDKSSADPLLQQIMMELSDCTTEEKELALYALRGLLDGLRKQRK